VRFYWVHTVPDKAPLIDALLKYELTPEGYVLRSHVEGDAVFRSFLSDGLEPKLAELARFLIKSEWSTALSTLCPWLSCRVNRTYLSPQLNR
jgi:hypothetical protein